MLANGASVAKVDFLHRAFDDMYYLIDKFAPFSESEGPPRLLDTDRAELPEGGDHTKN
jgi:protein-ribulosamine 3-kinase